MTLRKRCEVLKAIAGQDGKVTLDIIATTLPEFSKDQIQKAVYQLLQQDRIFKGDGDKIVGISGRPQYYYIVNEEWGPAKQEAFKGKRLHAIGRKSFTGAGGELATNTNGSLKFVIKFRDRKIKLLLKLLPNTNGTDLDLLIGLLADLGHKYQAVA